MRFTIPVVLLAILLNTAYANIKEHVIVARIDKESPFARSDRLIVKSGGAVSQGVIKRYADNKKHIAIIIDAGPNQKSVLPRETEFAVLLVNKLSHTNTAFSIGRAGFTSTLFAATLDASVATNEIQGIVVDNGKMGEGSYVPIYDLIGSAFRQISESEGLRVVVFVGEGNNHGGKLDYEGLCSMAEANHIAVITSLVADHPLHGTKSILRYGWWLQALSGNTAGNFLENEHLPKMVDRVESNIRNLCTITFQMDFKNNGRHNISIQTEKEVRIHAQKAIID